MSKDFKGVLEVRTEVSNFLNACQFFVIVFALTMWIICFVSISLHVVALFTVFWCLKYMYMCFVVDKYYCL